MLLEDPWPSLGSLVRFSLTFSLSMDILLYSLRFTDDPEERRRSLGSRSLSIDPVETFRSRYIETPLKVKGSLDSSDLEVALARCKNEVDQGILNNAQFNIISKQLVQVSWAQVLGGFFFIKSGTKFILFVFQLNEGIKIRQVQEMDTALRPGPGHLPNPWNPGEISSFTFIHSRIKILK